MVQNPPRLELVVKDQEQDSRLKSIRDARRAGYEFMHKCGELIRMDANKPANPLVYYHIAGTYDEAHQRVGAEASVLRERFCHTNDNELSLAFHSGVMDYLRENISGLR